MDAVKNFAIATLTQGYDNTATSIVVSAGEGARFPTPPFNAVWWNATTYPNPADDPNREIVRVTAITTDTLTVTRGQETTLGGLAASTKNAGGATYKIMQAHTALAMEDISDLAVDVGQEVIWVTENGYEATGDGTTDDRAAIQLAIDDGNLVIFPPGTFIVGAALQLKSNLTMQGSGIGVTTIKLKASAGAEHVIKDPGSSVSRVTIENMTIDGNESSNASALDGIAVNNGCDRFTLRNVEVFACNRKGVTFGQTAGSVKHVTIDGCHVYNCDDHLIEIQNRNSDNTSNFISNFHLSTPALGGASSKCGIVFSGPVQIANGTIDGIAGSASTLGIFGRDDGDSSAGAGGHDSNISNVIINGSVHASNVGEGIRIDCDRVKIQNCTVNTCDYGIRAGTSSSTGDDVVIDGCTVNGGDNAIRIEGDRVVVRGSKIIGTPTLGIDYRSTADEGSIKDNYITGATKVTVSGSNLHARNNVGWKTSTHLVSSAVDVAGGNGTKTTGSMAHGLGVTPSINNCTVSMVEGNGDTTFRASTLRIFSADATNVEAKFAQTTAGLTSATILVCVDIDVYP